MSSPRIVVIGASGQVGSETVVSALARGHDCIAFLRTPAKLSSNLRDNAKLRVVQGDAQDETNVADAIDNDGKPISCVVIAAPMGNMRKRTMDYENIVKNVIKPVKRKQDKEGSRIKVWIMAGGAVLGLPNRPKYEPANSFFPITFYPQYQHAYDWLVEEAQSVDWTMMCPALITKSERIGPFSEPSETIPLYNPGWISSVPYIGIFVQSMIAYVTQKITFKGLADFMVENISCDGKLKGKKIGIVEEPDRIS